jgi:hypothetical protein
MLTGSVTAAKIDYDAGFVRLRPRSAPTQDAAHADNTLGVVSAGRPRRDRRLNQLTAG